MRKVSIGIALMALLIVGVFLVLQRSFPGWRKPFAERFLQQTRHAGSSPAVKPLPLIPHISLKVAMKDAPVVYPGTPLIFSVTFANQRAMSAAMQNRADELYRDSIETKVTRGELSRQQADPLLASLHKRELSVIRLGNDRTSWQHFVSFVLRHSDGKEEPLPWPLRITNAPATNSVSLDDKTTPQLLYFLDPTVAAQVAPGTFEIAAVFEVKEEGSLPSDAWHGRTESEPVKLIVVTKPARLAPAEEETMNLQFARYYQATNDLEKTLQAVQNALKANPDSIFAHILVGEVKEAQGDFQGALEAYDAAREEFYSQHPNSYEAPLYLIHKSEELTDKLKSQP